MRSLLCSRRDATKRYKKSGFNFYRENDKAYAWHRLKFDTIFEWAISRTIRCSNACSRRWTFDARDVTGRLKTRISAYMEVMIIMIPKGSHTLMHHTFVGRKIQFSQTMLDPWIIRNFRWSTFQKGISPCKDIRWFRALVPFLNNVLSLRSATHTGTFACFATNFTAQNKWR